MVGYKIFYLLVLGNALLFACPSVQFGAPSAPLVPFK